MFWIADWVIEKFFCFPWRPIDKVDCLTKEVKKKKSIILLFTYILKSYIKFFSVKLTQVFFITLLNTYLLLIFKWKRLQDWQWKVWNGISFDKILRRLRNSKKTQGKKMKSCKRWKMKNWLFVHIWKWVIFGSKAQRLF